MVVAVVAVGMVQMLADQEVRVVAVRNGFVATSGAVAVAAVVLAAHMTRRAVGGILGRDVETVLLDAIAARVVKASFVEVIGVASMPDHGVAAT